MRATRAAKSVDAPQAPLIVVRTQTLDPQLADRYVFFPDPQGFIRGVNSGGASGPHCSNVWMESRLSQKSLLRD